MLAYKVITEDGFGEKEVEFVSTNKRLAEEFLQKLEESGKAGIQNYPMPDWAEYWDQVGYSLTTVRVIEI